MVRFSVIIPTYNRPALLAACLGSFLDLEYPPGAWELIIVNDGGERSFSSISDSLRDQLPLVLIENEHGGPAKARNAGARTARGEFLSFTDDDCRVDPNWLQAYDHCFSSSTLSAAGGSIINPYPDNLPAETWSQYMIYLRTKVMRDTQGNLLLLTSNNAAYRRDVFLSLGGFDEEFPFAAAEDSELGSRLVGSGFEQDYCPEAIVWHEHKNTPWAYLGQQFRYGRGNYYFQNVRRRAAYPAVERQKTSFFGSMRNLRDFAGSILAPLDMRLLLFSTPFVFKAGHLYEALRVQLLSQKP